MRFTERLLITFGIFLIVCGIIFGLTMANKVEIAPMVFLFANGIFFFFIAIMIRAAPAMDYMREHRESAVDRQVAPYEARKEELAPPPPPKGVHIPGPSYWPAIIALAAMTIGAGLVFRSFRLNALLTVGVLLLFVAGAGWALQSWKERAEIIEHEQHDEHGDEPVTH